MCGIVGVYSLHKPIDVLALHKAMYVMAHRGPDDDGIWLSPDKVVGLGHRRLSIVDIENGQQPLSSHDNRICVTVNGEFYDDKELRAELEKKGYVFSTQSDSELLIHLYQEYGLNCLERLRGEFAFILYDVQKNKLIAARDRFGIKPICYHLSEDKTLYIASEAKAIFKFGIKAAWNEYAMFHATCFQYKPLDQTLFKDIFQLLPGQLLIYDGENLALTQYWDLNYPLAKDNEKALSFIELKEQLQQKFSEAIACRLRSDEAKLCCHLSGGIDSAAIASFARTLHSKPLPCFSVSFSHVEYDESKLAQALAEKIDAPFYPVQVDADDIIAVLEEAVYYSESLAINNHLSAKYLLNQEIKRQGFKIALTGEGSDELFLGYPHFKQDYFNGVTDAILNNNPLVNGIQITNEAFLPLEIVQKKLGFIPHFFKAKAAMGLKMHRLLCSTFKEKFPIEAVFKQIIGKGEMAGQLQGREHINQSSYFWIKYALASYILKALGDGCEMAHSIEGRVPFLDHHLFEFVKKIPAQFKLENGKEKVILREMVRDHVTPDIYHRQKHAFMAPPLALLNNKKGIEFVQDELRAQSFQKLPFYDQAKVIKYLDALSGANQQVQIAAEPVLMLMLTSSLLSKRFAL